MRTAKIFKSGNSQAVRLPKDFQFEGGEVYIKRIGRSVVLIPKDAPERVPALCLENWAAA